MQALKYMNLAKNERNNEKKMEKKQKKKKKLYATEYFQL